MTVAADRRVLLVRGVNVGGSGRLSMAQWRALAEDLGAREVSTYIASGNLICYPPEGDAATFDQTMERALQERFGLDRDVVSRSATELADALTAHPFEVHRPSWSFVTFLSAAPRAGAVAAARALPTGEDRWEVIGREMHVRYAAGAGRPQMRDVAIGRALGVAGTARNLNTVRKLVDLAS